jgi:hypothetical protein
LARVFAWLILAFFQLVYSFEFVKKGLKAVDDVRDGHLIPMTFPTRWKLPLGGTLLYQILDEWVAAAYLPNRVGGYFECVAVSDVGETFSEWSKLALEERPIRSKCAANLLNILCKSL